MNKKQKSMKVLVFMIKWRKSYKNLRSRWRRQMRLRNYSMISLVMLKLLKLKLLFKVPQLIKKEKNHQ